MEARELPFPRGWAGRKGTLAPWLFHLTLLIEFVDVEVVLPRVLSTASLLLLHLCWSCFPLVSWCCCDKPLLVV